MYNPLNRKGILLAGGTGSRMYPMTITTNKHLLPVYDKPMIYYSLSLLMLAGIQKILIIGRNRDTEQYKKIFGDGTKLGLDISYAIQEEPRGIAEAFLIAEYNDFLQGYPSCLVLGDNIMYGADLSKILRRANSSVYTTIFGYQVKNPERYGVINFDENNNIKNIVEKPKTPPSKYAVPGVYFCNENTPALANDLEMSARGEYEITDLLNECQKSNYPLDLEIVGRGHAWLDAGTPESYLQACNFIQSVQERQNFKVGCIEEIAVRMGYITISDFYRNFVEYADTNIIEYNQYLDDIYFELSYINK